MYMSKAKRQDIEKLALRNRVYTRKAQQAKHGSEAWFDYIHTADNAQYAMTILLGLDTDGFYMGLLEQAKEHSEDATFILNCYVQD